MKHNLPVLYCVKCPHIVGLSIPPLDFVGQTMVSTDYIDVYYVRRSGLQSSFAICIS